MEKKKIPAPERAPFLVPSLDDHCSINTSGADPIHVPGNYSQLSLKELSKIKGDTEKNNPADEEPPERGCRNYLGILLALLAGLAFTIGTVFVKFMPNYHALTLAVFRLQGITIPALFLVLYESGVKKTPIFTPIWPLNERQKWKKLVGVIARSSLGCTALFLYYEALQYMSIADVAVISSCRPMFVTVAAFLILGEPFGLFLGLMTILTMVGVGVITRPPILTGKESFDGSLLKGAGFALASILLDTCVLVIVRSLKEIHVSVMMLFLGIWGSIQTGFLAYLIGELKLPENGTDWLLAMALATTAIINQGGMNLALQCEQASIVSLTRTMDFIFAFPLEFILIGVIPDLFSLCGASIIIKCVLLITFRKWLVTLEKEHPSRKTFWFVLI